MRLKQNFILSMLIIILISSILTINMFNILSISKDDNPKFGRGIKVNKQNFSRTEKNILEIIWDISGSMWGQLDNKNKITISKKILTRICTELPSNVYLGLRVFGKVDSKNNSFLVIKPAPNNKQELLNYLADITPAGKSPLGISLLLAQSDLEKFSGKKNILVVTDGKDTGEIMPSKIIKKLAKNKIRTHILHVGKLNRINQLKLKSLAELGNGKYFTYFEEKQVIATINLE